MEHAFKSESVREEHPALKAWTQLMGQSFTPRSVDKLVGASNNKSSVYRLNGACRNGDSVIAKRAKITTLALEETIYQIILPRVPVKSLHCFGLVQEKQSDFCWMFMEEALGTPYSESDTAHKDLASEWMALVHSTTAQLNIDSSLPKISPVRYLSYLHQARDTIANNLNNPALSGSDGFTLKQILGQLDVIKRHWDEVVDFCESVPKCLVHGDFISKNVFVCNPTGDLRINVIDWEASGWGIPAEDIGGLNLDVYWSVVKDSRFALTPETLQRLSNLGLVFRYLAWIHPTSLGLKYSWVEDTIQDLSIYKDRLAEALYDIDWI